MNPCVQLDPFKVRSPSSNVGMSTLVACLSTPLRACVPTLPLPWNTLAPVPNPQQTLTGLPFSTSSATSRADSTLPSSTLQATAQ